MCVCVGAVQYLGGTDVNPNLKIPVVPVERSRLWLHNVATRIIGAPPPPPTKDVGLNSVEPGAPLGGLAQDLGGFD